MSFKEALKQLEHGKRIKLPEWEGFWFRDNEGDISIFTKDNKCLKMKNCDLFLTLSYVSSSGWEVLEIKTDYPFPTDDDFPYPNRLEVTI